MIKRIVVSFFLCLGMVAGAAPVASAAPAVEAPQAALKSSVEQLQSLITKHHAEYQANPQAFYKVVNQLVVPRFDVPYIAQLVMSRYWRQATAQQRLDFQNAFKDMLIRSYANALLDNADTTTVEWLPSRYQKGATTATVKTMLVRNTGQKYPINFSVRLVDGSWKIYDIVVDNISLVLNFRTQIGADLQRNGVSAVIAKMRHETLPAAAPAVKK
ncbi:MAG TPA: ABC transporter substrate-binding protein [Nevskiaceae bacterium]|nr:ABC transporter substrate-binding protein [Nevskiaceae bacterium]